MKNKVYSGIDRIPTGLASDVITEGCIVLEGGAWRGLYTEGVLDALMLAGINMQTVIGVSAGAMNGIDYIGGQIGRTARMNLNFRHDPNYIGLGAFRRDHGITGFSYLYSTIADSEPLDMERFNRLLRRFVVTATDCDTGKDVYFEHDGSPKIFKAIQASATVPYVSEMVIIDGHRYLDGGIACKIPIDWALQQDFRHIVVVRTRDRSYRKPVSKPLAIVKAEYSRYPALMQALNEQAPAYNILLDRIDRMEEKGRIFVIAPSKPVRVTRFEKDIEKLGDLYWCGYQDTIEVIPALKAYLADAHTGSMPDEEGQ